MGTGQDHPRGSESVHGEQGLPPYRVWLRSLGFAGRLRWRLQGVADVVEERVLPRLPGRVRGSWYDALIALERRRRARCPHRCWGYYSPGGLQCCERCGTIRTAAGVIVGG
jgi:hypothetical protein